MTRTTQTGELFIVSAPSGTGKNTLIRHAIENVGSDGSLAYSVSYTTRAPRKGERDGVNYHFVDRPVFEKMVEAQGFLEWAEYNGNLYGTAVEEVLPRLEAGVDVILEIEVQGAEKLLKRCPEGHAIFLLPPSREALENRIVNRGLDDKVNIARRLAVARTEIECYGSYHYVIINDDLKRASQALAAIILDKRHRVARQEGRIAEVLAGFRERSA
ncbi:MAG: guanylate kinase [Acidobacteriota bacterium]